MTPTPRFTWTDRALLAVVALSITAWIVFLGYALHTAIRFVVPFLR